MSMTLKDVSVMISMTNMPIGWKQSDEHDNWGYIMKVVDIDPKPIENVHKFIKLAREIEDEFKHVNEKPRCIE